MRMFIIRMIDRAIRFLGLARKRLAPIPEQRLCRVLNVQRPTADEWTIDEILAREG